jgi:hypothetical protein
MATAVPCERCQQLVDGEWLEYGLCLGCRREHTWLASYAKNESVDRDQLERRHHNSKAQARAFMGKYGKKLKSR